MLQACLNGGLPKAAHPMLPVSPEELARDALAVSKAGADELHIHVRSTEGAETLAPEAVANALTAIRHAVPGMPVGISSGAWIAPGGVKRHAHIKGWTVRPDYASVNVSEDDAPEIIQMLIADGVGVEAGLWNAKDAQRFVAEISPDDCLRVLVEMNGMGADDALAEAAKVFEILAEAGCTLPSLLHGEGDSCWPCVKESWRRGIMTRVGFEDVRHLPDGRLAPDNASLVGAALAIR
ncbi:MAG: 3-keto-5-aminohexanoate cleavage protein [Hyphomicrobiales bacterium]|nr:3-keto-5-aminohexanoate cleavage protein [Hyphomicrobiales bacterium]